MIELIYEKSLLSKVKIVKKILESNGTVNKAELVNIINTSVITLEKYLNELLVELPENSIIFEKDIITINPRKCNLYDVKILYLSQSIIKDILKLMFSEKNYSLENMAQKLYISHSKLFKVLKHMD
ncbi:helix-turn-helix domain-containing protein, partial [Enterococcus faecium]|uniref:helix-turn-helix domain-containing protein n=1 Tax=Enterococcus faecium TaxID=1352 RepID=UPI0023B32848